MEWKPSILIARVMSGDISLHDVHASIQSACAKPIYDAAKLICKEPDKAKRREMLDNHPDAIRPHIQADIVRLWRLR